MVFFNGSQLNTSDHFLGFPTRTLENSSLRLDVLTVGPRIVRLNYRGSKNLFAESSKKVETEYGSFYFLGGHRLWHSPEAMPRTYQPDIGDVHLEEIPGGLRITRPPESSGGIVKRLEVSLDPHRALVWVRHELRNDGLQSVECAPWALTMLRLAGTVILPQRAGNVDSAGLLPNRQLVLWPYTKIHDPRLHLGDDFITITASSGLPPLKIGYFNPHGWIAYWIDGVLFVKRYEPFPRASFPDSGCNTETFCNDQFVELETLGALGWLEPGKSFIHTETWELYGTLDQPFIPPVLQDELKNQLDPYRS